MISVQTAVTLITGTWYLSKLLLSHWSQAPDICPNSCMTVRRCDISLARHYAPVRHYRKALWQQFGLLSCACAPWRYGSVTCSCLGWYYVPMRRDNQVMSRTCSSLDWHHEFVRRNAQALWQLFETVSRACAPWLWRFNRYHVLVRHDSQALWQLLEKVSRACAP